MPVKKKNGPANVNDGFRASNLLTDLYYTILCNNGKENGPANVNDGSGAFI